MTLETDPMDRRPMLVMTRSTAAGLRGLQYEADLSARSQGGALRILAAKLSLRIAGRLESDGSVFEENYVYDAKTSRAGISTDSLPGAFGGSDLRIKY
jgi:hypothetical protein